MSGLFWDDTPTISDRTGIRMAPAMPHTDWVMPETFPDLQGQGEIAIDVETFDPDLKTKGPGPHRDGYIAGIAVGTQAGFRQYYPIAHQGHPNLDKGKVLGWLGDQLKRPDQPKVGANLIYDLEFLGAAGVPVAGPFYDVQVAEPLLDETQLSYSLENIAKRRLGEGKRHEVMDKWLTLAYGGSNIKGNIYRAPPGIVGPYAESDVDLPLRIFAEQKKTLQDEKLWDLFLTESGLIPMLLKMKQRGVRVDVSKAEQLRATLEQHQAEAMAKIKDMTGHVPDIWSSDSIAKMFDDASVYYPTTEKGAPSFRKDWLEKHSWGAAKALVTARHMAKYRGTFVEGYILNGAHNGRIHTQFHQLRGELGGAVSGRFSSSLPNLQNLPIRDPVLGPMIRDIFIPEDGCRWWKIDWSQIEFRLAVHYASLRRLPGSQAVVDKYLNDRTTDYHRVTAELTGLPRAQAKSINFGIVYGLGLPALCEQLGIDMEEGEVMLAQYHRELPFVKPLYSQAQNRARDKGEIKTLGGRKRRFNTWQKGSAYARESELIVSKEWENGTPAWGWKRAFVHKALNALLQGSAADIMKTAMVQILESGVIDVLGAPHLTVHDELDGSLPDTKQADEALRELMHIMENCVTLEIPLLADMTVAESWGKTKS